jgi:hypothetical protein
MVTVLPSAPSSTLTCGRRTLRQASLSASIAAITDSRASVDSEPSTTRSYGMVPSAAASVCAAYRAAPCSAGSDTCTALSAPIDRALRIVSVARSGPMDRTVTSPPCASLSRSASSTAYSSSSFMTASTDSRSNV